MKLNKLSARFVATATVGKYGDGGGLVLKVRASGSRAWVFRFTRDGRSREMGLGPVEKVPLATARRRAQTARELVADDGDPIEARRAHRRAPAFRAAAEELIERHRSAWGERNLQQWESSLERFVYPMIGNMRIDEIGPSDVLRCLDPLWSSMPNTGKRVAVRIKRVLNAAIAQGFRVEPSPDVSGLMAKPGEIKPERHFPAMPWQLVPDFMVRLGKQGSIAARALELIVLTCVRTTEARRSTWSEFDLDAAVWVVPGGRTKTGKPHRVPLSDEVVALLQGLPDLGSRFLFPSPYDSRKPLGESAILRQLRALEKVASVHGFRSAFRDWTADVTDHQSIVAEQVLGHAIGSATERAYRRSDLFGKRVAVMAAWSVFCTTPTAAAEVVPIREGMSG